MCKKILYVEDEDNIRDSFSFFFGKFFNMESAENGEVGLNKFIENDDIDLIITDINMPVMNGLDMIEKIRSLNKDVLIYVVSAFDDVSYMERAYQYNTNRFIEKPVKLNQILNYISEDFHKEISMKGA